MTQAPLSLSPATRHDYAKSLATLIAGKHEPGTLTLVVLNRVSRAQAVFDALTTPDRKTGHALYNPAAVALVHSRFRRSDRRRHEELLFGEGDRIVIATQAVEAGVDVSARLLITELAPWSSLVQRMGRCNRRAEYANAEILWVDVQPKDDKDPLVQPYTAADLARARTPLLTEVADASPRALGSVTVVTPAAIRPVIRRRDLLDLFDTTPDVCGQDLDISRYIRDAEDNDVQFFWRPVTDDAPSAEAPPPHRDELCRVSIADASKFLKHAKTRAWRWDPLDEKWQPARAARPGAVYLVDTQCGGYCDQQGWTGEPRHTPTPVAPASGESEAHADEPLTLTRSWQTLADHTAQVRAEMETIAAAVSAGPVLSGALLTAALWHDVGKAHPHFQLMLADGPHAPPESGTLYAKSANGPARRTARTPYRSIRHELASALVWLLIGPADAPERDLVAYLIAAHHGKIRLSIRSLPTEAGDTTQPDRLFARGLWHGETVPPVTLPGLALPETTLDLSFMHLGDGPHGPSWLARTLRLRDRLGPFHLAFLETLLRAADARASALAATPQHPSASHVPTA